MLCCSNTDGYHSNSGAATAHQTTSPPVSPPPPLGAPCSGQARLVMRQKGNLRLLMNANLWGEMQVSKMEGGKVRAAVCCKAIDDLIVRLIGTCRAGCVPINCSRGGSGWGGVACGVSRLAQRQWPG